METLTNFWNQVCEIWATMNTFYRVSFIVLVVSFVIGTILSGISSKWAKLGDDGRTYKYETFSRWVFLMLPLLMMYMLLYPLWYILLDDRSFMAWCLLIIPLIFIVFGCICEIKDHKKNKKLIKKHQIWVNSLEAIQSLLKDRLSAMLGNDLSVEEFEFCVPQNNERYPDDGLISFVEGPSILAKVRKTLKKIPPASKVVIADERIYILPKDNGDTRIRNMEKELFKDMLVDLSKIRYSIVFKKDEDYFVVSRGCLILIIIPRQKCAERGIFLLR